MVHETIDGTYRQTNLTNESPEYLAAREELRKAEIELMRQRERVAELRRALPAGAIIEDYELLEGPMPNASVKTAVIVKPKCLINVRTLKLRSCLRNPRILSSSVVLKPAG